jgi:general secretion pathway protein D
MHKFSNLTVCALTALAISAHAQQVPGEFEPTQAENPISAVDKTATNGPKRIDRSSYGTIELQPHGGRFSFHLRADQRSVIPQVLGAYNILVTLDDSVKGRVIAFDGDDLDFAQATELLGRAAGVFFTPLDATRVLAAADAKENRARFERLIEQRIYVPATDPAEISDMENIAHTIFDLSQGGARDSRGRFTVRAPEERVDAMNRAFAELFQARSELLLEVRVCEVDRSAGVNAGAAPPNSVALFNVKSEINNVIASNQSLVEQIIASGLASAGDYSAILAALLASGDLTGTVFNNPFVLFGGGLTETGAEWNTASANMLLNSSDVRSLTQMQLRVMDGEQATFRSGQRYPTITSTYTAVSATSTNAGLTVPQVQYQDLGLTLKVKPSIESESEVSLNVNLTLSSLAGSTINNLPVLANRQYSGVVSVHFGTSALIVSAMSRQDARATTGLPGLNDLPGLRGGTDLNDSTDTMDLVILVTPHLIRLSHPEKAGQMLLLASH